MSENKAEKFFNSITNIKEEHIEFANGANAVPKAKKKVTVLIKYIGLAACFGLAIFAGARVLSKKLQIDPELPMLTITENDVGMGFEGYMAHDISELVSGNPWDETAQIATLPVYENKIKFDVYRYHTGQDLDRMREYLNELIDKFGLDKNNLTYDDDSPSQKQIELTMKSLERDGMLPVSDDYFGPRSIWASDKNMKVSVNIHMGAWAELQTHVPLPRKYDLSSYDGALELAEYLKEEYVLGEYKNIFGIKDPQIGIRNSDYNIYGERSLSIFFYEKGNNIVENIINYNLYKVSFTLDDNGSLWMISISNNTVETADKIGDYPIISADKAKELLLEGKYATSVVQWDMPGEEYIAKVELIYRADGFDEIFMPYYRFYIELPEASPGVRNELGLKTYGAYYVPAVEGRYIENMPVYDGHFN